MAPFEVEQDFSHAQLTPDVLHLPLTLLCFLLPLHPFHHLPPVLQIASIDCCQLFLPQDDLLLDLLPLVRPHDVEMQQFLDFLLAVLNVDDVQLQTFQLHVEEIDSVGQRVAEGGEVDAAVDCAARSLS